MKTITLCLIGFIVFSHTSLLAQDFHPEYEDKYLGWMKMFDHKQAPKPFTIDHRNYSAKQMGISYMLVDWVQQSYTPKGAIGQAFWMRNEKLGLYNQETKSLPQVYGTTTKTLIELKKNPAGKLAPETNTNWFMNIAVNGKIGDHSDAITTPEKYFFYIPGENGLEETEKQIANLRGFSTHPGLKKYISWFQPKGIRTTLQYVVLLCKDNVKPYIQLTKGEYIEELGKAIERDFNERITKIKNDKSNNAKNIKYFSDYETAAYNKRIAAFQKLKEKYKNRLNEPAKLTEQQGIHLEHEGAFDVFENSSAKYPVYKFDPAKLVQSKSDNPQWIVISWDAEGVANANKPGTHLHQSMLDNIDYDFIYNYFFYPEKVKGIAYKPLRSPTEEEKIVVTERSDAAKQSANDATVFFFDDFSTNPAGQKPIGWKSEMNFDAKYTSVINLKDRNEKWLEIKGQSFLTPSNLKKPLPQNFELSFDLAVPKDIPWGAKALEFFLGTKNKFEESDGFIKLRFRAGFSGRPGEVSLQGKFGAGYFSNVKPYYDATGFSNDKEINVVKITLKKKGESLEFFIAKNKIADIPKAFPNTTSFNWLQLTHSRSDGETEKYFISNFKIIKE